MDIYVDSLDKSVQDKYQEFKEEVKSLLKKYETTDKARFDLVKKKIEETNGNWDTSINIISGNSREEINISQLLAYEYCLSTEIITNNKVSFEEMLDKLFDGMKKFRIGNPVPGRDDECLYGKAINDTTAIPVTSKKYRAVMNAGAQHLDYYKAGEVVGAVFIYKKGFIRDFAHDDEGNPIDYKVDGIDFDTLNDSQSLLSNLRQTAFHEWTHHSEKEILQQTEDTIPYEYESQDGRKYRNYEIIDSYVIAENGLVEEPEYIYGTYIDPDGNERREFYYVDEHGIKRGIQAFQFGLQEKHLDKAIYVSQGLETREIKPNGKIQMNNIITEGFVEATARAMVRAIAPETSDIDEEKYPEYVAMAEKIISSRDASKGENGAGQTYADFLMHSTILKGELESKSVEVEPGKTVDGLQYISDYANDVLNGRTEKRVFMQNGNMMAICEHLQLNGAQVQALRDSGIFALGELTQEKQEELRRLLLLGNNRDSEYVDSKISEFVGILQREKAFFDGIPAKLGYTEPVLERKMKVEDKLGLETVAEQVNIGLLEEIAAVESREKIEDRNSIQK